MSHFDDNYVDFLSDVMADTAIEIRREIIELLGEDTTIYSQLDMLVYSEAPIESRLTDFDLEIIKASDQFLIECGIQLVDPTNLSIRADIIRAIHEVGFTLDPDSVIERIEDSINTIDAFGEICGLFGSLDPVIYINHLHYVADECISDILENAKNKLALSLEREENNDLTLLNRFSRYVQELDERTLSHINPFLSGLSDCYTLFEHGMGLYISEISQDLVDEDHAIACIKMTILYAISKDKESIPKEKLIEDLTSSLRAFIDAPYLNKLVLRCYTILTEVLSYESNP